MTNFANARGFLLFIWLIKDEMRFRVGFYIKNCQYIYIYIYFKYIFFQVITKEKIFEIEDKK